MTEKTWRAVDGLIGDLFVNPDAVLDAALAASAAAGLPPIEVAPPHGKLLMLLARIAGARRILEIGTLGGYSTIWLARALPEDGRLVTLEADPKHAEIARRNIAAAGLTAKVEVRLGPALETLRMLADEKAGPFDLFFLDADKPNNPAYFEWALRLARKGSVIVGDNVIRSGKIADAAGADASAEGARRFLELMAREKRVSATAIQTVGAKGHDGFALALVVSD